MRQGRSKDFHCNLLLQCASRQGCFTEIGADPPLESFATNARHVLFNVGLSDFMFTRLSHYTFRLKSNLRMVLFLGETLSYFEVIGPRVRRQKTVYLKWTHICVHL